MSQIRHFIQPKKPTSAGGFYYNTLTTYYETIDGIAFNKAINYLRAMGGGNLYIPAGTYVVYACLQDIDFPCTITGEGKDLVTIQASANAPGNTAGFGLFNLAPKNRCSRDP